MTILKPDLRKATNCFNIIKRKNLWVRAVTLLGQPLPQNWEEKLELFKVFVKNKIKGVQMSEVGNKD